MDDMTDHERDAAFEPYQLPTPYQRSVGEIPQQCPYCVLNGTTGETGCTCGYLRQLELQKAQQEGRTATSNVMYHVAPRSARESIMANGLDRSPNWLWHDIDSARTFTRNRESVTGQPHDYWAVEPSQNLNLRADPNYDEGMASYTHDWIGPESVRLLGGGITAKTAEIDPEWYEAREPYQGATTVYRGFRIMSDHPEWLRMGYGIDFDHLGIHWTTDEGIARQFATPRQGGQGVLLTAQVLGQDIIQPTDPDFAHYQDHGAIGQPGGVESEVTIRPGSEIHILSGEGVMEDGSTVSIPSVEGTLLTAQPNQYMPPFEAKTAAGQVDLNAVVQEFMQNPGVQALATPQGAFDKCKATAMTFARFAQERGLPAQVVNLSGATGYDRQKYVPQWQELAGGEIHYAVQVGDQMVDFAARQFDPDADFPQIAPAAEYRARWESQHDVPDDPQYKLTHDITSYVKLGNENISEALEVPTGRVMYHGRKEPPEHVLQHGIEPEPTWRFDYNPEYDHHDPGAAVYLATDPKEAAAWAGEGGHVYQVNAEGLSLGVDPFSYNENGEDDNYYTTDHLGPERLTYHGPAGQWRTFSSNDKTSMKLGAVPEGYEIRPMGDTGYFEHEEGKWRPRYYEVKDRNTGEMVRGDRMQTSHGTGDGVVAYYGDDPVGSLTWQEEPHATMIGSAYVHPDHRQQGLFNAMYEYLPQGKPVDAYHWDNPMLRQKVRDRQRQASVKLGGYYYEAANPRIDDDKGGIWWKAIYNQETGETVVWLPDELNGKPHHMDVGEQVGWIQPGHNYTEYAKFPTIEFYDGFGLNIDPISNSSNNGRRAVMQKIRSERLAAKLAMDWLGDAYPGEDHTEEKTIDQDWTQLQFTEDPKTKVEEHNWIMSGGYVKISDEDFESLMALMGAQDDWKPLAYGTVEAYYNYEMMFHLQKSNIATHLVEKGLKKYCTDHQLKYEGILSSDGTFWEDQAKEASWERTADVPGVGRENPDKLWRMHMIDTQPVDYYGEQDPKIDNEPQGEMVCPHCGEICDSYGDFLVHEERAHNDGLGIPDSPQPVVEFDDPMPAHLNTNPDTRTDQTINRQASWHDFYTQYEIGDPFHGGGSVEYEVVPSMWPIVGYDDEGNWKVVDQASSPEEAQEKLIQWQSQALEAETAVAPDTFPIKWEFEASRLSAKMPLIPAPIPAIFDIEGDKIHVGQPGERHEHIKPKDKLTVNVVEMLYLPDGKLQFRTDSTMPYTVRYLIRLWYTLHPELEVKSVFKLVKDKKFKLANAKNIGAKVRDVAFTDQAAKEAYSVLSNYGDLYIVGGAVRDICLGHLPEDIDLLVAGLMPEQVSTLLNTLPGRVDFTGQHFGVFRYKTEDGSEVEIALPRTEMSTGEGHKDFQVQTDAFLPVEEDLARRDFTGNAMAVNMRTGEMLDPFNGQHDLSQGHLKLVNPQAFQDDPLRVLRAFSAMSRQGLRPDEETKKEIEKNAYRLRALPPERIQFELDKIFGGKDPESAIRAMRDEGVLHYVMPEVAATIDFDQKNKHHRKVLDEHLLDVLRKVAEESNDPDLRLAALFHDVGKPHSQWMDEDGHGHYYKKVHLDPVTRKPTGEETGANHEEVGAQMTHDFMTKMKYPNDRRDRVVHLVRNHMFNSFSDPRGAGKFLKNVGDEHGHDLLTLRKADQEGKGTDEWENQTPVSLQRQLVDQWTADQNATKVSDLAVNGNDLIAEGIPATSEMGRILNKLLEAVINDPSLNNKAFLLEMARDFHQMKDASVHKTAAVPPAPGAIPAPPSSVRLYHYTGAPEGTLEREGIDISKAKGESYGEPNYVWASTQMPDPYSHRFAEFFMPHDDPRWDIGKYTPGMKYQNANGEWEESPEAWAHHLTSHGSNVTFYGSIRPEEIVAVHEPWHSNYRYMKEGNMSPEELSWIADQREQFPNEYRAYQELLKDHGRTSSILDPIRDSLDEAVFEHADADMPRVKPKIRHFIKRTIYKVLRNNNYPDPEEWTHLVLTGSLTTYQWSPSSDLDIALFLTHPIPDWRRAELISLLLKHIEDVPVPGTTHRLGIYIEPVERKPSDIFRPGLRSAFDIDNDRWIVLPERERTIDVQKEMGNLLTYAKTVAAKMKTLILYDPPGARTYWHQIAERWRRDQTAGKGDYCLAPDTVVLTANYEWKPIGDLLVGEELVGFDEYSPTYGRGYQRTFQPSRVLSTDRKLLLSYRVKTDRGEEVVASANHLWLVQGRKRLVVWKSTEDLLPEDKIVRFGDIWGTPSDLEAAAYLAGLFDGEGHITKSGRLSFAQKEGIVMEEGRRCMDALGFRHSTNAVVDKTGRYDLAGHLCLLGGIAESMKFLFQVPTVRLRENGKAAWVGRQISPKGRFTVGKCYSVVESVEALGLQDVVAMETSTRTLIAAGLYSHNSNSNIVWKYLAKHNLNPFLTRNRKPASVQGAIGSGVMAARSPLEAETGVRPSAPEWNEKPIEWEAA